MSEEQIEKLNDWCSFEKMKNNPKTNYNWYKEYGLFIKEGSFFRKGKSGDWLNYFTGKTSKIFDEVIEKNLNTKLELDYGISKEDLQKIYTEYEKNNSQKNAFDK